MNEDEARKVLGAGQRERKEKFQTALTALLKEHGYRLIGTPYYTADGRTKCELGAVPVETNAD